MQPSLTINRMAVAMHFARAGRDHVTAEDQQLSNLSALMCEIAERLDEMDEVKRGSAFDIINRLANLGRLSPVAQRITIQLLHNSPTPLQSFMDQAEERGITKQCVHHEFHHEIAKIRRVFPELAAQLEAMRAVVTAHEDPSSNADSIRSCVDGDRGVSEGAQ